VTSKAKKKTLPKNFAELLKTSNLATLAGQDASKP